MYPVTCNLGHSERIIRIGLGLLLLAVAGLTLLPGWGTLLALVIGAVALLTGFLGFCPAWRLFKMNTCDSKPAESSQEGIQ